MEIFLSVGNGGQLQAEIFLFVGHGGQLQAEEIFVCRQRGSVTG